MTSLDGAGVEKKWPGLTGARAPVVLYFLQKPIGFEDKLTIGDESAFHLNGRLNSHNVRHYVLGNTSAEFNFDVEISREKVTVWMVLCGSGDLIGPVCFEGNLTGNACLNILNEQIIPELCQIHENRMNRMWWIQDGAPCHRTIPVHNLLTNVFNTLIIAVNQEPWGWGVSKITRLIPCVLFLWGYLKSWVYLLPTLLSTESTLPVNAQDLI